MPISEISYRVEDFQGKSVVVKHITATEGNETLVLFAVRNGLVAMSMLQGMHSFAVKAQIGEAFVVTDTLAQDGLVLVTTTGTTAPVGIYLPLNDYPQWDGVIHPKYRYTLF